MKSITVKVYCNIYWQMDSNKHFSDLDCKTEVYLQFAFKFCSTERATECHQPCPDLFGHVKVTVWLPHAAELQLGNDLI